MPLATLRRRKCHYLIAGLSFPAFGLLGAAGICMRVKVCATQSLNTNAYGLHSGGDIHSWGKTNVFVPQKLHVVMTNSKKFKY